MRSLQALVASLPRIARAWGKKNFSSGGGRNRTPVSSSPSSLANKNLHQQPSELGVSWEYGEDGTSHIPAEEVIEFQESLQLIIARWPPLPSHLQQAILAIVGGFK